MNADGSGQTQITSDRANGKCPAWSPDGKKIAFSDDLNRNWQISVMNADGSNRSRLTENKANDGNDPKGGCIGISWSPDGQKIAFISNRNSTNQTALVDIYVMNADGSQQTQLTNATVQSPQNSDPPGHPTGKRSRSFPRVKEIILTST